MRAVLLGGTGFIGSALAARLLERGYDVVITTRKPQREMGMFREAGRADPARLIFAAWDSKSPKDWVEYLDGADACVNLVGENIAGERWTSAYKERLRQSRLNAGRLVCEAMDAVRNKPRMLVQCSAIGYYGPRGDEILSEDEADTPARGPSFLAELARAWEASTLPVEELGVRRVVIRTGVVLGRGGGALEKIIPAFRLFAGGPLGAGRQWFSWIHLQDVVDAICHLIATESCRGVFNLTAPAPATMKDYCRALGHALHRPSWLPIPAFSLKLMLGDMADELLLNGQRVVPKRLLASGYAFAFPQLDAALRDLLS